MISYVYVYDRYLVGADRRGQEQAASAPASEAYVIHTDDTNLSCLTSSITFYRKPVINAPESVSSHRLPAHWTIPTRKLRVNTGLEAYSNGAVSVKLDSSHRVYVDMYGKMIAVLLSLLMIIVFTVLNVI